MHNQRSIWNTFTIRIIVIAQLSIALCLYLFTAIIKTSTFSPTSYVYLALFCCFGYLFYKIYKKTKYRLYLVSVFLISSMCALELIDIIRHFCL